MDVDDAVLVFIKDRVSDYVTISKGYNEVIPVIMVPMECSVAIDKGISCLTQGVMKHLWIR